MKTSALPSMTNFVSLLPLLQAPKRSSLLSAGNLEVVRGDWASEEGEDTEERVVQTWTPAVKLSQTRMERAQLSTRVGR